MDVSVQSERNREIFISESTLDIANDILENLLLNVEDVLHAIENRDESPLFEPATNEEKRLLIREIEEIEENAYYPDTADDEPEIDLVEIEENDFYDTMEEIDSAASGSERIVTSRRLIALRSNACFRPLPSAPVAARLLPDIDELDVESDNDDSLELNSFLDSDSENEVASYHFPRVEPSEDVGDRDEFDDMEGMEFVEFYLRDAILRQGYNHGSGDYVAGGSDDEDEEDDEIEIV